MLYCLLVVQLFSSAAVGHPPAQTVKGDSLLTAFESVGEAVPLVYLSRDEVTDTGSEPVSAPAAFARHRQQFSPLRTVSEIIAELTGTISPEAGRSTGIPLLRGSSVKRIAVTYDGVPLTHSAQREGPSLMSLAMIDPSIVGTLSFASGFQSVVFPAVQTGGVLQLDSRLDEDRLVPAGTGGRTIMLSQQFSSADRGWSGRLSAAGQAGNLRYRVGGLGRILGDLRAGNSPNGAVIQPYTGLRESTLHALASYAFSPQTELRGGVLTGWRDRNAIVTDLESLRLSSPPSTLDVFSPRQMTLAYLAARYEGPGLVRRVSATTWFNRQRENATVRRPVWGKTMFDDDRIMVVGLRGRMDLAVTPTNLLGMAIEARSEGVDARRKEVRDDETIFHQRGRFPGGTVGRSLSALLENRWSITSQTALTAGMRWTADHRRSHYGPSVFGASGLIGEIDRTYVGLSWYAYASHDVSENRILTGSVSSMFAAPGLDDLASNAYWYGGRDVPNPHVGAERAVKYEVSYRTGNVDGSRLRLSVYRTSYLNLISREWFGAGPDGGAGTNDDLFRFTNRQASVGTGLEIDLDYPVATVGEFRVILAGSGVVQHVSAAGTIPRFMPPAVYRAAARLERGDIFFEPYVRGALRTPATHLGESGATIASTSGWTTVNVRSGIRFGDRTSINFAMENLTDVRYREHGSNLEASGRNLILALSYSL